MFSGGEPPLRSELFSADQMQQHGKALAAAHQVSPSQASDQLLARLTGNEGVLLAVRDLLTESVVANRPVTPAGEWLLDNFYLIEEQIRTAKRHLPKGYSRQLPRLSSGPSAGLPRVFDIALETISHGDGRVDPESLSSFVGAYQTVTPLKLGELWALPIMLRLALIENLRRVAALLAENRADRNNADVWADQMIEVAERDPKSLILVVADMARSNPPMVTSFVAELTRRLQGQSAALALPLTWIEQRLSESGWTIKELVQSEIQQQAENQLSMSNSIGSLRFLGAVDWREFVERMSAVEKILREDVGAIYEKMDFATRDRYRHVVENIARHSDFSETEVAREAIRLAHASAAFTAVDDRSAHVGFYLIDKGLAQLDRAAKVRASTLSAIRKLASGSRLFLYFGAIGGLTAVFSLLLVARAAKSEFNPWILGLLAVLSILCTSQLAIALVNWLATLVVHPHSLPRMDLSEGIGAEFRALAVVPTMLGSAGGVDDLIEALEVRFLANRDENLRFALLTDFPDAAEESLPEDDAPLQLVRQRIQELNQKYRDATGDVFFLFHRRRLWNPRERIWMGYERKRGKLEDLNAYLRGRSNQFAVTVGNTAGLSNVRYVITLDTDTQLPRDAAWQFIGAMAHPLNRPRFDEKKLRVTEGYGILQPRVGVSLPGANRSRYARLHGSEPGIDPYTRAVSDVYQDLFHQGSFIGKGIYDVDAFDRALAGRLPENRILSHDLLEGCYARAGLLSDSQLIEEYPPRYSLDVSRRHRWIRGDWQLVRWLFPGIPGARGGPEKNPLSALSRWKIFDNLRRSLVPTALTLLLLLGWTILSPVGLWTLVVLGIILLPGLISTAVDLLRKPEDVLYRQHLAASLRMARNHLLQASFTLACLPYEAYFSLDAVLRTLWRMLISRKRLLEWRPSGESQNDGTSLAASWRSMWISPVLAVATGAWLVSTQRGTLPAFLTLGIWFASPSIAWWISRPLVRRRVKLTQEQTIFLQKLSRKTWAFFETFVGPKDNWLPPDNFQQHPAPVIGHRTSPTNMGLALLANLSAYDFGYVSAGELVERTGNTLRTMESLERHRGHFYNWYDTETCKPLLPIYISTVDSGNLAGHLLTLRPGLLSLADRAILSARLFEGLGTTLGVLADLAPGAAPVQFSEFRRALPSSPESIPVTLSTARECLQKLTTAAEDLMRGIGATLPSETGWWAEALAGQCNEAQRELTLLAASSSSDRIPTLREVAADEIASGSASRPASDRIATIEHLALLCAELASMEYGFLYDQRCHLLSIGYNVAERRLDPSYYDLLASEARLCSFVAIAQGQLPQSNWFALGRLLTIAGGEPILVSWSGSMFEYLMPLLVMPTYENTLLHQTYKSAVERQIEYGRERGVPWGISESGYNAVDASLNYQYRAFGVPGLGLKRGLAEDLVIAPYASALALMVAPEASCVNLERLAADGFEGRYGFYEAIDYTASRVPRGQLNTVVRSFMAHHQGMSFLSLAYLLLDRPMQKRFESDPLLQSSLLLLQERIPKATSFYAHTTELAGVRSTAGAEQIPGRVLTSLDTPAPDVQLLSNGRYNVMVTAAGGGYSRWKNLAVTRWREDTTCDNWGTFCYIRELKSGRFWSTAYHPTAKPADKYEAIFTEARAEFRRSDRDIDTHTEIAVSPEDDIELRRITIGNSSRARKTIDVTSYAEVVLAPAAADDAHPAFSNLFVQTEILPNQHAILCTRRPRSQSEQAPWMFHLMTMHGAEIRSVSYETDRMQFIGRGNTVVDPDVMRHPGPLSGSQGSVLDPVVAIRYEIRLDPEETATFVIVSGVSETREGCLSLIDKYQDRRLADRVFDLAWTHSQVVLRHINSTEADAQLYSRIAGSIIYANASLRAEANLLLQNRRGQSGLWGSSISGDLPIVLLQIADAGNIELVRQLVQAHAYWRLKGLPVDLVIWNDDHAGYRQQLQEQIMGLVAAGVEPNAPDRPAGERPGEIFVRSTDQMSNEDRVLMQSVARAIVMDTRGSLAEQIGRPAAAQILSPRLTATRGYRPDEPQDTASTSAGLLFFNGTGGFTPDGREYIITTSRDRVTPAPWVNVLANAQFGTVVSESGTGCTWAENAHEFRITPWQNDPVGDASGEAFYVRDEESGYFWSPTPLPCRGTTPYITRHGFGYSVFEHTEQGIHSETWIYVAIDAPVKFTVVKLRNDSQRTRRLSVTGYAELILGDMKPKTAMHVVTELDPGLGAILARNPYNAEFPGRVAFFHMDDANRAVTGDRTTFIGRNGTLRNPAAMGRTSISGSVGAAWDPCAAMQVLFELAPGQEREIVFRLGVGRTTAETVGLLKRFRGPAAAFEALEAVWQFWKHTLGAVHVETPDESLNVLANGWLVYQTLACRLWGRSGFYQSGGAFGFRDQLQDTMALIHAQPQLLRQHLLVCAARQFTEGDVQHWWHPPSGRGVRTHCSDDFLWLPLATCRYVLATGDRGVLDEPLPFLQGRAVNPGEDSYYDLPSRAEDSATLYEHCCRAILRGLATGEHGLPLMGSGDWNDGMNLVGEHGKGESVWLAFFLYHVLLQFAKVAHIREDAAFVEKCESAAAQLRRNIEENAWDGEWYRRAYFDDGTPLGSSVNEECRVDSISQSWSVLSGAGDPKRSRMAMEAVDQHLVRRKDSLVQLLDPPFDKSSLNPGYIKGYVPGVRENGGQYTHAAIWTTMAFAALGDGRRAWELFGMINPVNHAKDPQGIATYKVEPYVVAADVYAVSPHVGRGGWTWYTGSAGWMYRLIIESLLGLDLQVDKLHITPCLPAGWNSFKVHYRYRETVYHISITRTSGHPSVVVDGVDQPGSAILLVDDRQEHSVDVNVL
jgi:cyclic beta-1,2-glucan synthetase